jgi:hemerythrin superfamily protein
MNIIEQLMVEHASLRLQFRFAREGNSNSIYELEEFVRKCHARIEDEIVFPKLRESLSSLQDKVVTSNLSRLEADHRLIDKIGDQIKLKTVEGDIETLRKRVSLYVSTVESHNAGEEMLIFPYWKVSDEEEEREAKSKAWKIIREFGLDRYFAVTGFSDKLVEMAMSG